MFTSNYYRWTGGRLGPASGVTRSSWQWQPITYGTGAAHDPNPPIIIEDAPAAPTTNYPPPRMMMGMGM